MKNSCGESTPNTSRFDRIEVTWRDAWFSDGRGWESRSDYETEMDPMTSVGYHVETTEDYVILAMTISTDEFGGLFRIPVGCVIATTRLSKRDKAGHTDLA